MICQPRAAYAKHCHCEKHPLLFQGEQGQPGLPGPEEVIELPPDILPIKGYKVGQTQANIILTYIYLSMQESMHPLHGRIFYSSSFMHIREIQALLDHVDQRAQS